MVTRIILLRPKRKEGAVRNGQIQRVETLYKKFVEFGFPTQVVEVGRFPTLKDYRLVTNLLANSSSVLAITSFILLPWCLSPLGIQKIKIIDMMDSLIKTRKFSKQNLTRWIIGKLESLISIAFKNDHIRIYISEYDRDSDKAITPKKIKTFVIPNEISMNKTGEVFNLKRLVFVGDLNYSENRIILGKLCGLLDKAGMQLNIYGAGGSKMQPKYSNHNFHGTRDDDELYQDGDLHLAPVRNMHGLSSKVFHPISRGIPVLTTDFGTNGINKSRGIYIENEMRIWPDAINEIFLKSQNSPLEVYWTGFKCDETGEISTALIELLTKSQD